MNDDELLTVEQVADRLKVGRTKVYELLNRGDLLAINIDRCRRILPSSVDAFIARKIEEAQHA